MYIWICVQSFQRSSGIALHDSVTVFFRLWVFQQKKYLHVQSYKDSVFNSFPTDSLAGEFSPLPWPACSLTTVADVAILGPFELIFLAWKKWVRVVFGINGKSNFRTNQLKLLLCSYSDHTLSRRNKNNMVNSAKMKVCSHSVQDVFSSKIDLKKMGKKNKTAILPYQCVGQTVVFVITNLTR